MQRAVIKDYATPHRRDSGRNVENPRGAAGDRGQKRRVVFVPERHCKCGPLAGIVGQNDHRFGDKSKPFLVTYSPFYTVSRKLPALRRPTAVQS